MEKIKRFIECLLPVTVCNLRCNYCYIIQEKRRTEKMPAFQYDPEYIGKALSKHRLGGTCYVSICGAGETLIPPEIVPIVQNLLEQGHYVNITTNGTISGRFDQFILLRKELLKRLHFSFSLHYVELMRLGLVDEFFSNIRKVKTAGCSFFVQFNLCDEYIPHLEAMQLICEKEVGSIPQVAATRNELTGQITLLTQHSRYEYEQNGKKFNSPLFEFTMRNFMVPRNEFCYAGDWSFVLDLCTGEMKKCYASTASCNIFEKLEQPIKFNAIGNFCKSQYCINSSHFMTLGVIPNVITPTYAALRVKPGWYTSQMQYFLSGKLRENNREYGLGKKIATNIKMLVEVYNEKVRLKMARLPSAFLFHNR